MPNKPKGDRDQWEAVYTASRDLLELVTKLRAIHYPDEKMADPFPKRSVNRSDGPMMFLADIILKRMEKAGFPSRIHPGYRSAQKQRELFRQRPKVTNADQYESAHQFFEAVDIVHKSKFWDVSEEYWDALAVIVKNVSKEFGVPLVHGHYWKFRDSAHIEVKSWRDVKERQRVRGYFARPTSYELNARFDELMPLVRQTVVSGEAAPLPPPEEKYRR